MTWQEEQILKNPNFIKWFGNSKVVDSEGIPLKVYHGSTTRDFETFKVPKYYSGIFFTSDLNAAIQFTSEIDFDEDDNPIYGNTNENNIYECYLRIEHPYELDCKGRPYISVPYEDGYGSVDDICIEKSNTGKYDGCIFYNILEGDDDRIPYPITDYVVFSPNQIKSTEDNYEYSLKSDNIYESKITERNEDILSDEDGFYLHGDCQQWALNNYKPGDKFFFITDTYEDNRGYHQYLVHCGLYRDNKYIDVLGSSDNLEEILEDFDYDDPVWEILTYDEFIEALNSLKLPYKKIKENRSYTPNQLKKMMYNREYKSQNPYKDKLYHGYADEFATKMVNNFSEEDWKYAADWANSLEFPLKVYRGIQVKSKEDIKLDKLGNHWTTDPEMFNQKSTIGVSKMNYILSGYVDEKDVDWAKTMDNFMYYSINSQNKRYGAYSENEIYVRSSAKVKDLEIKEKL